MRVATLNLWMTYGDWAERRAVLREGLRELRPDVIGLQEVVKDAERDSAAAILGPEYELRHQATGLLGDRNCAAIASRWPIAAWHEVDLQLTPRTADFPATTLIAEIDAPDPLLYVNHLPAWKPQLEHERELQTVAAVRRWRSSSPVVTWSSPATSTPRRTPRASASCAGCSRSAAPAPTTATCGSGRIRATPATRSPPRTR